MANTASISRPYARAIFAMAQEAGDFQTWSDVLANGAAVVADDTLKPLIDDPRIGRDKLSELVTSIMPDNLPDQAVNTIRLLSHNGRLDALPAIAAQYEVLRAEAESTVDVQMVSAREVTDAQQQKVAAALEKRMGRKVKINISIDESLLGGAVIRAGDLVIDGSARSRLEKLSSALAS